MFTFHYNGMFINGHFDRNECRVTDDHNTFQGLVFKTCIGAKRAITKARKAGIQASNGIPAWGNGQS